MVWRLLGLLSLALAQGSYSRINIDQMQKEGENPDYFTLIYLYDIMSERSHKFFPMFQKVAEIYQGAIKSFAVDCGNDNTTCPPPIKEALPSVFAYIPYGYDPEIDRPFVLEKEFFGIMDESHIREFVETNLHFLGSVLTSAEDAFFQANSELNRILFFTDKGYIPLMCYLFAGKYRGRLDFGVVFSNQTEVGERFNVTEYPTVLAISKKGEKETYDGAFLMTDLGDFLRKYAAAMKNKKRPVRNEKTEGEKSFRALDIHKVNSTNFNETLYSGDKVIIALFAKKNATQVWNPLVEKYSGMLTFLEMNCSDSPEEADFAQKLGVKRFPSMRVFPVNRTKHSIELSFDDDSDIDEQILRHLSYNVESLSDRGLKRFFDTLRTKKEDGVLLITNKSEHFPFKMAATVSELKPAYHFAQYNKHSKELQELMKAQKFPTIIVIKVIETGDFRFVEFTGNLDDFSLLRTFLLQLRNLEVTESPKPVLSMDLSRVEELYSKTYQSLCLKKGGICAMAMFNGSAYDPANSEAFQTLKTLQKYMIEDTDYHFGWVDGLCESELRTLFELQESSLPTLILYVPKREKAAKFEGNFSLETLKDFLQKSAAGKVKTFRVEGIQFTDRNCDALGSEEKRKPRHTEL